jgi:hypothetical protein
MDDLLQRVDNILRRETDSGVEVGWRGNAVGHELQVTDAEDELVPAQDEEEGIGEGAEGQIEDGRDKADGVGEVAESGEEGEANRVVKREERGEDLSFVSLICDPPTDTDSIASTASSPYPKRLSGPWSDLPRGGGRKMGFACWE